MPLPAKKFLFPFLIFLLVLIISALNYKSGTYLSGWDTLHPEFNFPLNFNRLIFGVWRTEQGLGAVAGHSHMADLPRVFVLWLLHFILPLNSLRYTYIFLCLLLGPLGIYFLTKHLFKKPTISFVTALVYIFNLATVQIFIVPFEMFPTQYAFLPWIILFSLKFLKTPTKKHLLYFSLTTLLATPQAYAAHLWYTFFAVYLFFLLVYLLLHQKALKKTLTLIFFTLTLNSFWLLPNLYYTFTLSSIPKNTWTNRIHSQEFLNKNRQFGYPTDLALQKGFYFDWNIRNPNTNQFEQLASAWLDHTSNFDIQFIAYLTFSASAIGLYLSLKYRSKKSIVFLPLFLIPATLLLNNTPPFKQFFNLLISSSTIKELFRFIFNKLSNLYLLSFCLFFAFFLTHLKTKKLLLITLPLTIFAWPIFTGQLIHPYLKQDIPDHYFQFWNYMSTEPPGTILALPLHQKSGWQYYDWGYQGSGFIWFGLPQPILDRDFDRWEQKNEQAYRDFFFALYANDQNLFNNYLKKYNISYIVWDQSQISTSPKNQDQITFKHETDLLLNNMSLQDQIKPINQFDNLFVYQVQNPTSLITLTTDTNNTDFLNHILTSTNRIDTTKFNITPLLNTSISINNTPKIYQTSSTTSGTADDLNLPHNQAYIVGIKSNYQTGIPLRFCFYNPYSNICILEDQLSEFNDPNWDYFFIPPMDQFSDYQLQINVISEGGVLSKSTVYQTEIIPIPDPVYQQLNPPNFYTNTTNYLIPTVIFANNSLLSINSNQLQTNQFLTLNQSYNSGWLAFYFSGLKPTFLKDHVLVNNWANGWQINENINNKNIYILFWPQLLQFLGFALIPLSIFSTLKYVPSKTSALRSSNSS